MGLVDTVVDGVFEVLEPAVNLLVGHPPPPVKASGYVLRKYPLGSPFYHEVERWMCDPLFRRGVIGAAFTEQFREDPVGSVARFVVASWSELYARLHGIKL